MTDRQKTKLAAVVIGLLALLMLIGSLNNGERRFGETRRLLAVAETTDKRIDNAVLGIQTHVRSDYDTVAVLQAGLRELLPRLAGDIATQRLATAIDAKLVLIERYKSRHAVYRNSLRIIPELRRNLQQALAGSAPSLASALQTLEWALFRDVYAVAPATRGDVAAEVEAVKSHPQFADIADSEDWRYLDAHIGNVLDAAPDSYKLFNAVMAVPVAAFIDDIGADLAARYELQDTRAQAFLLALFAMTIALLILAAQRVVTAWRYKSELERRVEVRTRELSETNGRLRQEMDEKAQVQQELAQAQKLESIGQLSAGIAHEINTPTQYVGDNISFLKDSLDDVLGVIRAVDELAGNGGPVEAGRLRACLDDADMEFLQEELPRAISESAEGIERVTRIVRALKDFSHPSREKVTEDLNRAIRSTATVATNEWKYVADLECDLDDNLPPVPCILGEFNQVMLNMIVNAAHAVADAVGESGAKGRITLRTREVDGHAEITVSDTGAGMPADVVSRVFDPFFTTKEVGKGTGQGLFIAHNVVVEKHGGTLTVASEPGQGTCFTIRLPLEDPLDAVAGPVTAAVDAADAEPGLQAALS